MSAVRNPMSFERSSGRVGAGGRRIMNPYLAGFGLGLVLLASFLIMGRGLGATAASGSVVAWAIGLVAPDWVAANPGLSWVAASVRASSAARTWACRRGWRWPSSAAPWPPLAPSSPRAAPAARR